MGIYINPENMSKEQWLAENAEVVYRIPERFIEGQTRFLCLVNNGAFTACGVAYCAEELKAFKYEDGRPKIWFECDIEKIKTVIEPEYWRLLDEN